MPKIKVVAWDFDETIRFVRSAEDFNPLADDTFTIKPGLYNAAMKEGTINDDDITYHSAWYKITMGVLKENHVDSVLATQRLIMTEKDGVDRGERATRGCYHYLDLLLGQHRAYLTELLPAERKSMTVGVTNPNSYDVKNNILKFYHAKYNCKADEMLLVDDHGGYMAPTVGAGHRFVFADPDCYHLALVLMNVFDKKNVVKKISSLTLPVEVTEQHRRKFIAFCETFITPPANTLSHQKDHILELIRRVVNQRHPKMKEARELKTVALVALYNSVEALKEATLSSAFSQYFLRSLARIACKIDASNHLATGSDPETITGRRLLEQLQNKFSALQPLVLPHMNQALTYDSLIKFTKHSIDQLKAETYEDELYGFLDGSNEHNQRIHCAKPGIAVL